MNSKKSKFILVSVIIALFFLVFFILILLLASNSKKHRSVNKLRETKIHVKIAHKTDKNIYTTPRQTSCLQKEQIDEIYNYFDKVFHKDRKGKIPFIKCSPYPPINEMLSLTDQNFCKTLLNFSSPFMTDFLNNSVSDWVFTLQKIINECIPPQDTENIRKFKELLNEINNSIKLKIVIVNSMDSNINVDGVPIFPKDSIIKLNYHFWLPDNDVIVLNDRRYFICELLKDKVLQTRDFKIICQRTKNIIRIVINSQE